MFISPLELGTRWEEVNDTGEGGYGHSKDALSRAAKISPSVPILANSRSKISIPS